MITDPPYDDEIPSEDILDEMDEQDREDSK